MQIDCFASERHYADHLIPLYLALHEDHRGLFSVARPALETVRKAGIDAPVRNPLRQGGPLMVSSFKDLSFAKARPIILVEHGVGISYSDGHPTNPGGKGREPVVLFLCPNDLVASRNREAYPATPAAVIGCPKLDAWANRTESPHRKSVAISFHWDSRQAPEARWAFPHFASALPGLAERYEVLGHGHPRVIRRLASIYERLGIEIVEDFAEIMERAGLYVCDNSSTIYEFCVTGRPVVVLNAPWYRREVSHGLRHWDSIPGLQCDRPEDLVETIERALEDPPEVKRIRDQVTASVYPHLGTAASRGAAVILEVLGSM